MYYRLEDILSAAELCLGLIEPILGLDFGLDLLLEPPILLEPSVTRLVTVDPLLKTARVNFGSEALWSSFTVFRPGFSTTVTLDLVAALLVLLPVLTLTTPPDPRGCPSIY